MRFRKLGAVLAAATLCAGGLAGCRTNVGSAASVGAVRISETEVNRFVTMKGADASLSAQARKQGQDVAPKSQVLTYLIQEQLFRKALTANGGVPSKGTLARSQNAAVALLFQTQLTGKALTKALAQGLTRSGIRSSFAQRYLTVETLEYTLIKRKQLTELPQLAALLRKVGTRVSVSPRYGKWQPTQLQVDPGAGKPAYLKLQPTPGVSSSATAQLPGGGN